MRETIASIRKRAIVLLRPASSWTRDIAESVRKIWNTAPRTIGIIFEESRALAIVYSLTVIALTAAPIALSYVLGKLVDGMVRDAGSAFVTMYLPIIVLGTIVFIAVLSRYQGYLSQVLHGFLWGDVQVRSSKAIGKLDVAYHLDPSMQAVLTRLKQHAQWRVAGFADNQLLLFLNILGIGIAVLMLNGAEFWAMMILLATIPEFIVELSHSRSERHLEVKHGESWRMFWDIRHHLQETTPAIELKVFDNTERFVSKLNGYVVANRRDVDGLRLRYLWLRIGAIALSHLVIFCAGWTLIHQTLAGDLGPGRLTFLIGALTGYAGALSRLAASVRDLCRDCHYVSEFFEVADLSGKRKRDLDRLAADPNCSIPRPVVLDPSAAPELAFESVSFRYPQAKKLALQKVSMRFPAGSKIAIIGDSGAGKTTLVNLLCGFHEPTRGNVTVNGISVSDIEPASWHNHIGVLLQNYQEYTPFTVRDAILLGTKEENVSDERILAAAEEARALPFIRRFKGGLDQLLGKGYADGAQLSRGEWQRLRLAGVLLRNPWIMLLDEPTAALDAENETQIMKRLYRRDGRTLILITHRLSNCRDADWIYIMKKGKVVEEGTHDDLMQLGKLYYRRFHLQRRGYR